MKNLLFFCLLTIAFAAHAQVFKPLNDYSRFDMPDSLAVVPLKYELFNTAEVSALDTGWMKAGSIGMANFEKGRKHFCAFRTHDDVWVGLEVYPTDEFGKHTKLNVAYPAVLNEEGDTAWMLRVSVTYGHGHSFFEDKWMLLVTLNDAPTQVFKVNYGCDNVYLEGDSVYQTGLYEMPIHTGTNKLLVSEQGCRNTVCKFTCIDPGFYILKEGRIVKRK